MLNGGGMGYSASFRPFIDLECHAVYLTYLRPLRRAQDGNRACCNVAEYNGKSYRPLFCFGEVNINFSIPLGLPVAFSWLGMPLSPLHIIIRCLHGASCFLGYESPRHC
jgi:hypothetical protein